MARRHVRGADAEVTTMARFQFSLSTLLYFVLFIGAAMGVNHSICAYLRPPLALPGKFTSQARFSPDGSRILVCYSDGTVRVMDLQFRDLFTQKYVAKPLCLKPHVDSEVSAEFVGGSERLLIMDGPHTRILDAANWKETAELPSRLATASRDGTIGITVGYESCSAQVWDLKSGNEVCGLVGHTKAINSIAVSVDGERAASGSDDRTARLWDLRSGATIAVLNGHAAEVRQCSFSPDGRHLLTRDWNTGCVLWDAKNGERLRALEESAADSGGVVFSLDGTQIAAVDSHGGLATVWETETGKTTRALAGSGDRAYCRGLFFARTGDGLQAVDILGRTVGHLGWHSYMRFEDATPDLNLVITDEAFAYGQKDIYRRVPGTPMTWVACRPPSVMRLFWFFSGLTVVLGFVLVLRAWRAIRKRQ
jgi:hypothetical protein